MSLVDKMAEALRRGQRAGLISAESLPDRYDQEKREHAQVDHVLTHFRHCNHGENAGSCKYGDEGCPTLSDEWRWLFEPRQNREHQHEFGWWVPEHWSNIMPTLTLENRVCRSYGERPKP